MMHIVLFMEPSEDKWRIPLKLGRLYMNRFAIDEDAGFEIIKVVELKATSYEMEFDHPFNKSLNDKRIEKGKSQIKYSEILPACKMNS